MKNLIGSIINGFLLIFQLRFVHTVMAMAYFSLFWCLCHNCHEWVQYPFMMAIVVTVEKMGIMKSGVGVHTAVVTAM